MKRKALAFVGHYDYLLYSMLISGSIENTNAETDYIVLGTKNSECVNSFIQEYEGKETCYGHFSVIFDEQFLNINSENATIDRICDKYNSVLRSFGTALNEYEHIYMSYDEWNSFGIFLAQYNDVPPVSIILKHEYQLYADAYRFLDTPGKEIFSALQRKYGVLSGADPRIGEYLVLRDDFCETMINDMPAKPYSIKKAMDRISFEDRNRLFRFFNFNVSDYQETYFAVFGDSFWFQSEQNKADEYAGAYQTVSEYLNTVQLPMLFKEHPRYELDERERALLGNNIVPGYVPAELLTITGKHWMKKAYSVGNALPFGIECAANEYEVLDNRLIFSWRQIEKFNFTIYLAKTCGQQILYQKGLSEYLIDSFTKWTKLAGETEIRDAGKSDGRNHIYVFSEIASGSDAAEIIRLIKSNNTVVVFQCGRNLMKTDQVSQSILRQSFCRIRLRRNSILQNCRYNPFEDEMLVFTANRGIRQVIETIEYRQIYNAFGYCIRAEADSDGADEYFGLYIQRELVHHLFDKIMSSNIVIYGGGKIAVDFAEKYGSELNIKCIMIDADEKVDKRLCERFQVIERSKVSLGNNDYVIICRSFIHNTDRIPEYALSRDDLIRGGFLPGEHFIYYKLVEAIVKKKKIILFCGYCELGGVKQILDLTSAVDDCCMLFYHIGRETMQEAPGYMDFILSVKICDLLIHAPVIVKRGVLDENILEMVSETTKTIFVPQLSFRGYSPYKDVKFTRRNQRISINGIVMYPFLYQVPIINKMILEGKSDKEILTMLKRDDLYSEEDIKQNLDRALRILKIMDSKADISMYDYIADHYKDKMLFKDCIHANDPIFFEYARRLAVYLGKEYLVQEIDCLETKCQTSGVYFQVASEEPILPCVAKVLGLKFATPEKRYMQKITEEYIRMKKFDEWYADYCRYFRSVLYAKRTLNKKYRTERVKIMRNEVWEAFGEERE